MRSKLNTMASAAAAVVGAAALARYLVRNSRCVDIAGKVVLITGGSRGLGLVLAREFASRGSRVAICARHERELEHVREEFSEQGKHVLAVTCDVGVRAEVGRMVQTVREQLGPIDILVNNAGAIVVGPAENQDLETFEDTMQTNFWGPFYAISAVVDQMKNRRHGRIVNIASIGGKVAFPYLLPYTASKFALVGYSEGLRAELAKYNVFVTTVCPGLMRTGSPPNADFIGQPEKEYAWFAISDSLPIATIGAVTAARKIINACVHGDAEIHLGITAKLGAIAQGCAPGVTADMLSVVNRLMPEALPGRPARKKGAQAESRATDSVATVPMRKAASVNNQL